MRWSYPWLWCTISVCLSSFMLSSMMVLGKRELSMSTKSAMTTLTGAVTLPGCGAPGLNSDSWGNTSFSTGTAHFSRKLDIHLELTTKRFSIGSKNKFPDRFVFRKVLSIKWHFYRSWKDITQNNAIGRFWNVHNHLQPLSLTASFWNAVLFIILSSLNSSNVIWGLTNNICLCIIKTEHRV